MRFQIMSWCSNEMRLVGALGNDEYMLNVRRVWIIWGQGAKCDKQPLWSSNPGVWRSNPYCSRNDLHDQYKTNISGMSLLRLGYTKLFSILAFLSFTCSLIHMCARVCAHTHTHTHTHIFLSYVQGKVSLYVVHMVKTLTFLKQPQVPF